MVALISYGQALISSPPNKRRLVLEYWSSNPSVLALPYCSDSSKVGYVLQGSAKVGWLEPKKGDEIQVLSPHVSWWYNDGVSDFPIVFLGETAEAQIPGASAYTVVSGSVGIFAGFSNDFAMKALGVGDEEDAKLLVNSQPDPMIVKLKQKLMGSKSWEDKH